MGASNTKCTDLTGKTFTQIEMDNYQNERKKLFMSTIIICAIYAVISLILILLGSFTEIGKKLLFVTYLPFVIVFIIGSIIIILYFSNKINKFKPYKLDDSFRYDNNSCPDYWDLIQSPQNDDLYSNTPNDINQGLVSYICKANKNIYDKPYMLNKLNNDQKYNSSDKGATLLNSGAAGSNKVYGITGLNTKNAAEYINSGIISGSTQGYDYNNLYNKINDSNHLFANLNLLDSNIDSNIRSEFKKTALYMAGFKKTSDTDTSTTSALSTSNANNIKIDSTNVPTLGDATSTKAVPLLCDKLYPKLLAEKDDKFNKDNPDLPPNPYRCTYSKICGVSWSDVDCAYEKDTSL